MQIVPDNIFLPRTEQVMCRLRKIKDQEAQITAKYTPVEIWRWVNQSNYKINIESWAESQLNRI